MSVPDTVTATGRDDRDRVSTPGILGRLGSAMVARRRWVFGVWLIALVALGSAAPSVFSSLAGAGWQANGTESVQVLDLAPPHFGGNSSAAAKVWVPSDTASLNHPHLQQRLTHLPPLLHR